MHILEDQKHDILLMTETNQFRGIERSEVNFHVLSVDSKYFPKGNEREVNGTALFKGTYLHSHKRDSFRLLQ